MKSCAFLPFTLLFAAILCLLALLRPCFFFPNSLILPPRLSVSPLPLLACSFLLLYVFSLYWPPFYSFYCFHFYSGASLSFPSYFITLSPCFLTLLSVLFAALIYFLDFVHFLPVVSCLCRFLTRLFHLAEFSLLPLILSCIFPLFSSSLSF